MSRRVRRLLGSLPMLAAGLVVPATATPASAAVGCQVDYQIVSSWPGGFTTDVVLTNRGPLIDSWTLSWTFPDAGQRVTNTWSAELGQDGSSVTVRNRPWNGRLDTGSSVSFGFHGTWTAANPVPAEFRLGGQRCNVDEPGPGNQPPAVALTAPTGDRVVTEGEDVPVAAAASDPDGSVSRVEFLAGSTLIGTDTASPYTAVWHPVAAGLTTYSLTARAYDDGGASTTSAAVPVQVRGELTPRIQASPTQLGVPEGGTATFGVRLSRPPASGALTVGVGRNPNADPDLSVPAGQSLTFTAANWFTPQPVTVAAAQDPDATAGTASFRIARTAGTDAYVEASVVATEADDDAAGANRPPVVALAYPTDGGSVPGYADLLVRADASDPDGTITNVEFFLDGRRLGAATTAPYATPWYTESSGPATHTLTVVAHDDDGATTSTAPARVTVRAVPRPTVLVTPNPVEVPEGGTATVTVRLSEPPDGLLAVSLVRVSGDADLTVPTFLTVSASTWSTGVTTQFRAAADADTVNGTATFLASPSFGTPAQVTVTERDTGGPAG